MSLSENIRTLQKDTGAFVIFENNYRGHLQRQLQGERLMFIAEDDAQNLQIGISTDGILPSKGGRFHKPEDLAIYALSGIPGIVESEIKKQNISILVVGSRFGGGSAREHAPLALKGAGIEVIIVMGKAERIFKENCLYAGGPLVIEIEDIQDLNKFLAEFWNQKTISSKEINQDNIRSLIRDNGGLLAFTKKRFSDGLNIPAIYHPELPVDYPMTAVQKIIARKMKNIDANHKIVQSGDVGFIETDLRFTYELMTNMITSTLDENFSSMSKYLIDKNSIIFFEDHVVFASDERFKSLIQKQREIAQKIGVKLYRQKEGEIGTEGICHTLIVENALALPGQVVIGTDSHTCSAGVLGAYAFGVGATAMSAAFITKDVLVEVPESIRIKFTGKLSTDCTAKDVILTVLADPFIKNGGAIGKVFEFEGFSLSDWSIDQLFVLTNMSVEGGATTGILTEPTNAILEHLNNKTQLSYSQLLKMFTKSDPGAIYAYEVELDLSQLEPMVALPGHPSNGVALSRLPETKVTSAYVGSCTGGNLTDFRDVAEILKGKKTVVPLIVQAASMSVYRQAEKEGLIDIIKEANGEVLLPGCGACIGMGPGSISSPNDVIISATNRNFPGRMGKPIINNQEIEGGSVYLASPKIVAASSLTGIICSSKKTLQ